MTPEDFDLEDACEDLEMLTGYLCALARGDKSACFERLPGDPPVTDCACHIFYAGAVAFTAKRIETALQRQRQRHGQPCGCSKCFPSRQEETRDQRAAMNAEMRIERRDTEHERDED